MQAVGGKLGGKGAFPESAMKENHQHPRLAGGFFRQKQMGLNLALRPFAIGVGRCPLEHFTVPLLADRHHLIHISSHGSKHQLAA
jgi:hypothetical protein